jgi:peptidoglycan/LPS O-acetylase OafA/YrhL
VALLAAQYAFVQGGYIHPELRNVGYYTPSFCCLIAAFARQAGCLSHWCSSAPLVFLGEASFALYVMHYIVLTVVIHRIPGLAATMPELTAVLVVVASVAVSALAHLYIETPLRQFTLAVLRGRRRHRLTVVDPVGADRPASARAA